MLVEARDLGFLGPGPVEAHLDHAAGFAAAWQCDVGADWSPATAADLGSGAGLPGLPLALLVPATRWLLIEAGRRRAAFLRHAAAALGVEARVAVYEERAEVTGRRPDVRHQLDLVVARSFGPPAVAAECGAPLLRTGGRLVVSEPPEDDTVRWPPTGLELLGMARGPVVEANGARFRILEQREPCGDRFPRRTGIPGKRPLF